MCCRLLYLSSRSLVLNRRDKDRCRIFLITFRVVCCTVILSASGQIKYFWDKDYEVTPCLPFNTPTLATLTLSLSALKKLSLLVKSTALSSLMERQFIICRNLAMDQLIITSSMKSVIAYSCTTKPVSDVSHTGALLVMSIFGMESYSY